MSSIAEAPSQIECLKMNLQVWVCLGALAEKPAAHWLRSMYRRTVEGSLYSEWILFACIGPRNIQDTPWKDAGIDIYQSPHAHIHTNIYIYIHIHIT